MTQCAARRRRCWSLKDSRSPKRTKETFLFPDFLLVSENRSPLQNQRKPTNDPKKKADKRRRAAPLRRFLKD